MSAGALATRSAPVRQRLHASDRIAHAALVLVALLLLAFLAAPLSTLLIKAVQDDGDRFVGVANFISYAQTPALMQSVWNSVWVSVVAGRSGRKKVARFQNLSESRSVERN